MNSLFKRTVRAAYANPALRPALLPLLKEARQVFTIDPTIGAVANIKDLEKILDADQRRFDPFQMLVIGFEAEGLQRDRGSSGWGKYRITGVISANKKHSGVWVVPSEDDDFDPRAFQRYAMDALHKYSMTLPGEISVRAGLVDGYKVQFTLTSVVG